MEKAQYEKAKQLQEQAKLSILEDTENWIACDGCKKWRKSDKLGAYKITCRMINRKCEEAADDEETETDKEKEVEEETRLSQTKWLEQTQKWKEKYNRITDKKIKELYKIYREKEEDDEINPQTKEEKERKSEEEIETITKEKQKDLTWISCSDASVGPEGTGVAAAGVQHVEFQTETLLEEKHPGLGEIHGIYKQMQAAKKHTGKVYIVCDNQGIVRTLQEQETKRKLRKGIKEAYWNYTLIIQHIVEERKNEGRGETEFVWIKSHMSRNGVLNEKHTEQDRKAEEIAKDKHKKKKKYLLQKICGHSKTIKGWLYTRR